jgi:hypothetical protein
MRAGFYFAEAGSISEWYREVLDMHQWIHQAVSIEENDLILISFSCSENRKERQ